MKQYKYTVKGTIRVTRCYDSYTEDVDPNEIVEYEDEILSLFAKDLFARKLGY